MKPSIILLAALAVGAQASWFSSDAPQYTEWSNEDLQKWLNDHHIGTPCPSRNDLLELVKSNWDSAAAWSYDQYISAQKSFSSLRDLAFDTWDESRLREFLLEQGIVAPKGHKEELVLLVKNRYKSYTDAASSFASQASATASSAVYDARYQATQSLSRIVAQATSDVLRAMDDSKDYVYSTWDDNKLRDYLVKKGVLKSKTEKKREELLAMMKDAYYSVADPVWEAWSSSFIYEWLSYHNVLDSRSDLEKSRDALLAQMSKYYYTTNSYFWDTWSDSDLKAWLVDHKFIKSDARVKRDKMLKLIRDNYFNVHDSFWNAWSNSQLHLWLIDNGHLRSDAKVSRDELVKLMNQKYTDASSRTATYLTWPDARLRAFLREHGMSEKELPTSRPGLLQETRIRYSQSKSRVEALFNWIRDTVNAVGEKITQVWETFTGSVEEGKKGEDSQTKVKQEWEQATAKAGEAKAQGEL
ncbi:uncharacterized protein BT62DRAFT_931208 [Guyanagaster necrorhizus]|uniref:SAP domain-containing protein n=1 Tax=Guyanagaster necrorhizus TaxID=856835 RepID=A0A9P7VU06_9AGAR|nr:uncharacterized protein BT62DRAFT_931208 [Guyanagaster necrorhizus MCA 3950]KAG7447373.1 hypothetical protein BT62DRAFT_931208 [Guyanagaster necrorhizus MCA 3950]